MLDFSHFRLSQELQVPKDSQKFKSLRELDLKASELSSNGLKNIIDTRFPKLEVLDIEGVRFMDILSQKIKQIEHLKCIYLSRTMTYLDDHDDLKLEKAVRKFNDKASGYPRIRIIPEVRTAFFSDKFIHFK